MFALQLHNDIAVWTATGAEYATLGRYRSEKAADRALSEALRRRPYTLACYRIIPVEECA